MKKKKKRHHQQYIGEEGTHQGHVQMNPQPTHWELSIAMSRLHNTAVQHNIFLDILHRDCKDQPWKQCLLCFL